MVEKMNNFITKISDLFRKNILTYINANILLFVYPHDSRTMYFTNLSRIDTRMYKHNLHSIFVVSRSYATHWPFLETPRSLSACANNWSILVGWRLTSGINSQLGRPSLKRSGLESPIRKSPLGRVGASRNKTTRVPFEKRTFDETTIGKRVNSDADVTGTRLFWRERSPRVKCVK